MLPHHRQNMTLSSVKDTEVQAVKYNNPLPAIVTAGQLDNEHINIRHYHKDKIQLFVPQILITDSNIMFTGLLSAA